MDYLLHGNPVALKNLVRLFRRACGAHDVHFGQAKATMILMKLLEDAKEEGLFEEVQEAREGCEEGSGCVKKKKMSDSVIGFC